MVPISRRSSFPRLTRWQVPAPVAAGLVLLACLLCLPGIDALGSGPAEAPDSVSWTGVAFSLVGGLAIFLYGMRLMSEGMRNVFGDRMRALLGTLTRNRVAALAVGTLFTMIIQSSSATTVMLVGFVHARLMTFAQSFGVVLGARVGTTITAQIIAFRLSAISLPFVAAGFLVMLAARQDRWRNAGQGLLGFGFLFFGMQVMTDGLRPLSHLHAFVDLMLAPRPAVLGVLVGAALTALIQSSSAFTGLMIVMASQGLLTLDGAIPMVFGANIGTSITAALASLNTRREAKRVALAHALVSVAGALLFLPAVQPFATIVRSVSPDGMVGAVALPRQIANAHTLFNVGVVLVALPLAGPIVHWASRMLPELPEWQAGPYRTQFLDDTVLSTPALALKLARSEVVHMGQLVKGMVEQCVLPFLERRTDPLLRLRDLEAEVNFLEERIDEYLTQVGQRNVTVADIEEAFQLMYAATEFEQIADIVTKSVLPRAGDWLVSGRRFSSAGETELRDLHLRAIKQIARAVTLLKERSPQKASRMRDKYRKYRALEIGYMRSHFERLRRAVPESLATNESHQELMEQLVRIAAHATNVARIVLADEPGSAKADTPPPLEAESAGQRASSGVGGK